MALLKPKPEKPPALPGFDHVNRYWDRQQLIYVAKILPGEFYVSRQREMIATTLGSCVSACIWDETFGIGGMNHFMLPLTELAAHKVTWGNLPSDATRYGNYAMEHLINELLKNGANRRQLKSKIFGGGAVLANGSDVGDRNVDFVLEYLKSENIPILSEDLRNNYPRKIMFDPLTGRARMKKILDIHNDTIASREASYRDTLVQEPVEGDVELF